MDLSNFARILVVSLYGMGTLLYFVGVFSRREPLKKAASLCAFLGFGLHTLSIGLSLASVSFASLPKSFFVKLLSWSLLLVFFIVWRWLKMSFLALIASPLALLLYLLSLGLPSEKAAMPESWSGLFFGLHIASLFGSLALLAMAFGAGLVFTHLERKIKFKEKLLGFRKDLPSLATFDKVNHWAVLVGFPLFTLGMVSGFVWAQFTWGKILTADPKELLSLLIWSMYAFLFHQRLVHGWRGRKPAVLAIWIFAFTVVSLVGINYFLPTHHSFKG